MNAARRLFEVERTDSVRSSANRVLSKVERTDSVAGRVSHVLFAFVVAAGCSKSDGAEQMAMGSTSAESGTGCAVSSGDGPLAHCVALQFDACEQLTNTPAGFASECDDGDAYPLQGSLHRVEAVECTSSTTCVTDDDCAADEACLCASFFFHGSGALDFVLETRCYPASCRSDADCGEHTCAPTIPCGVVSELRCHGPDDECTRDVDCPYAPGLGACGWNEAESRWTCLPAVDCE